MSCCDSPLFTSRGTASVEFNWCLSIVKGGKRSISAPRQSRQIQLPSRQVPAVHTDAAVRDVSYVCGDGQSEPNHALPYRALYK